MIDRWSHRRRVAAPGALVVAVFVTMATGGPPAADAAPPATDDLGFVDSTARCVAPSKAVAFGSTSSSRVAICRDDASGQFQYRGVRVSDGARLILAAKSTDHGYVAENDGITYTVTSAALVISSGGHQIRSEPMTDFHGSASGAAASAPSGPTQPSAAPKPVTPTTPLPPPLPAEVGGG